MNAHDERQTLATEIRLALIFAILFGAAFPPIAIWWLAYWIPVPITIAAWRTDRPWRTLMVFTGAGAIVCALYHRWLIDVTLPGYPFMCLLFGLFYGLYALLLSRARRRNLPVWLAMPACWVGLEFLRGQIAFDGYPWYLLAHATMRTLEWERPSSIAYLASFVGAYGLSLIVCTISLPLLIERARSSGPQRLARALAISCLVIVAWSAAGAILARPANTTEPRTIRVGIVQTSLPQSNKIGWAFDRRIDDFARFIELTRSFETLDQRPDVIIWPETMYPGLALDDQSVLALDDADDAYPAFDALGPQMRAILQDTQSQLGVPLLVGTETFESFQVDVRAFDDESLDLFSWDARYNSVVMLDNGLVDPGAYSKLHLTPFGEVMPYISNWPWLEQALLDLGARGMSFDLDAGTSPHAFSIDTPDSTVSIAPLICFEATNPDVAKRQVHRDGRRQADVLTHITNDGWFGPIAGGRQTHALIARSRAIELGTPVVRVANTGISCAFDDTGRRLVLHALDPDTGRLEDQATLPRDREGVAVVDIPLPRRSTLASRTGDVGWVCLAGMVLCVVLRRKDTAHTDADSNAEPEASP
ncbi:MAG: apolipoprotein N-acyltransferase [Phycisphaerales bacterium JB043]